MNNRDVFHEFSLVFRVHIPSKLGCGLSGRPGAFLLEQVRLFSTIRYTNPVLKAVCGLERSQGSICSAQ